MEKKLVRLYEDNAGRLFVQRAGMSWAFGGFEALATASFAEDANVMLNAPHILSDWTMDKYEKFDTEGLDLIATFDGKNGVVVETDYKGDAVAGVAGSIYLGLDDEAT